jgi:hypothetical protein
VALAVRESISRNVVTEGIRIEPYADAHAPAARAFNKRIAGASDFGLAEFAPRTEPESSPIRHHHYVVLEGEAVRGGFLLASFGGWFGDGQTARVWNCREPLSEGLADPNYRFLAIRMLRHIQRHSPYIFALGMGSRQMPFPRLLRGAGWTILPVPFLFRVFSAARFARELRMFQRGPMRPLAQVAAFTGAAKAGMALLHLRSLSAPLAAWGCTIEKVEEWGSWADDVWDRFRRMCSFSVARDRETLAALYPLGEGKITAYLIRRGGEALGWAATMNTAMSNHKYFGNLRVGTILDCVAPADGMRACAALATKALARQGADLVVTNQSHAEIVKVFRQTGFLSAPSNYILAMSKGLSEEISRQPQGKDRMHFTRGDSDGRIHL